MYTLDDFKRRNTNDQRSLTDALAFASYQYYILNEPPMSDFEFDMEFKQLQQLESESGEVLPNSPTLRVGSDIQGGFVKRRHRIPMQSIENVYSDEELQSWLSDTATKLQGAFPGEAVSFTYEPKYDGVSISLVYTDGKLTDAVTRGNQAEGESVYENVKTIRNIPLVLDRESCPELPSYFEVRGEVLMTEAVFRRLNAEKEAAGERPFANKRNAAAGSLKQLDPKVTARRGLVINAFAAYAVDQPFVQREMSSQATTLQLLERLGFSYFHTAGAYTNLAELTDAINAFDVVRRSHELPYDCDGVVVKVNERKHQEYLGLNTTFPNWCKARKFPQEARSTLIRAVTFQVGMTGHITPVAELDPTVISGSVVSRATLNNENYIRTLGLKVGGYVFVQKAGEVIPQVTESDNERNRNEEAQLQDITFPTTCPCCGTPLQRKGEYWICPNHHCREQVVQRLEYWCGKDCANIRGLGPNVLSDCCDKLGITSIDDLYQTFAPLSMLPEVATSAATEVSTTTDAGAATEVSATTEAGAATEKAITGLTDVEEVNAATKEEPQAPALQPGEEGDLFAMMEDEPTVTSTEKKIELSEAAEILYATKDTPTTATAKETTTAPAKETTKESAKETAKEPATASATTTSAEGEATPSAAPEDDKPKLSPEEYRKKIKDLLGEGYAERSVKQLFDGVQQSIQTLTFDRMIGGFGIDGVGKISGKLLASHFLSLEQLRRATQADLLAVDGIGEVTAAAVLEFFSADGHFSDYSCLTNPRYGFNTSYQAAERLGNGLEGMTVLFTGTSYRFKRDEIKEFFTAHGAKYVGSVSGKVNFVVIGDAPGQNKLDKARQLGVEIVDERAFYERFHL